MDIHFVRTSCHASVMELVFYFFIDGRIGVVYYRGRYWLNQFVVLE